MNTILTPNGPIAYKKDRQMAATIARYNSTGAWGDRAYVDSTSVGTATDMRPHLVSVDARELDQYRREASASMHVAVNMQERMERLEKKFDKAIEILLARGINITELI
jgi:hypothetical protein